MLAAAGAAAAAASTTTVPLFSSFGRISYWNNCTVTTTVAASAGTGFASHYMPWYELLGALLVIVLHAVMTYDRSAGTREAGSGKFCVFYGSAGQTRGAPARRRPSAESSKKADPPATSAGLTRGSAENNSRVMMA